MEIIPLDVVYTWILPNCPIETRVAFGVPPRRLDTTRYETGKLGYLLRKVSRSRFDLRMLPRNAKISLIGTRAKGKTNLAMDILRGREDISLILSTRSTRSGYTPFESFQNFREEFRDEEVDIPRHGVVVFEGAVFYNKPHYNHAITNPDLMVLLCTQYPLTVCNQFDHLFVFHESYGGHRRKLWDNVMKHHFSSMEEFETALDRYAPERHDCMVISHGHLSTYRAPRLRIEDGSIVSCDYSDPGRP